MPERITFTIEVDGQAVSTALQITSAVVHREINRIPSARINIVDGEPNENNFAVSNEDTFTPGKELIVKAGDNEEEQIFKGIITRQEIRDQIKKLKQLEEE